MQNKMKPGFSLMEIMIAIAIMSIMAVLVGPSLLGLFSKGKAGATKATLAALKSAITDYYDDMGHVPTKAEGGLNALVEAPKSIKKDAPSKWNGPYLEGVEVVPQDAWGFDFVYNVPPVIYKNKYKRYEIISFGENGNEEETKAHLSTGA